MGSQIVQNGRPVLRIEPREPIGIDGVLVPSYNVVLDIVVTDEFYDQAQAFMEREGLTVEAGCIDYERGVTFWSVLAPHELPDMQRMLPDSD